MTASDVQVPSLANTGTASGTGRTAKVDPRGTHAGNASGPVRGSESGSATDFASKSDEHSLADWPLLVLNLKVQCLTRSSTVRVKVVITHTQKQGYRTWRSKFNLKLVFNFRVGLGVDRDLNLTKYCQCTSSEVELQAGNSHLTLLLCVNSSALCLS